MDVLRLPRCFFEFFLSFLFLFIFRFIFHLSSLSVELFVGDLFLCPTISFTSIGDPVDPVGDPVDPVDPLAIDPLDPVLSPWRRCTPLLPPFRAITCINLQLAHRRNAQI